MTRISSAQKTLRVLKAVSLKHEQGLRLTDVCRLMALEMPTAFRLLQELVNEGFLIQDSGSKKYHLGDYCATLGLNFSMQASYVNRYTTLLTRISARTGDASFLVLLQDLDTLCIAREIGSYPIQALAIKVGNRQPIGVGAAGLAMLSVFNEDKTEHYLEANKKRFLKYRNLSIDDLRKHISTARQRGYAVIGNHAVSNVTGVGVALESDDAEITTGISVAALDNRMNQKRQAIVAKIMREEISTFLNK